MAREKLVDLAPRLRRRATLVVRHVPPHVRKALEEDAALVRTGASIARAYGWNELTEPLASAWRLDGYVSIEVFDALQEQLNRLDIDADSADELADASHAAARRRWASAVPASLPTCTAAAGRAGSARLRGPGRAAHRSRGAERSGRDAPVSAGAALGQSARLEWPIGWQDRRAAHWSPATATRGRRPQDRHACPQRTSLAVPRANASQGVSVRDLRDDRAVQGALRGSLRVPRRHSAAGARGAAAWGRAAARQRA